MVAPLKAHGHVPGHEDTAVCPVYRVNGFHPLGCGFIRVKGVEDIDLF